MSKNRRKGKRRTDKPNQRGQGIAWLVIIMYLGLLAVMTLTHPDIAIIEWEPLGELEKNAGNWLLLTASSVVLFALLIKQDFETTQLRVGDAGILIGAAGTFLAAILSLEVNSEAEGILLIILAYPIIFRGISYLPYRRFSQVVLTVITIASVALLLSSISIEIIGSMFFIVYLSIGPVIIVLWLWVIAIVNGRRGI